MHFRVLAPCLLGAALSCGGEGGITRDSAGGLTAGPDPVVVRLPRQGGTARAFRFAALDSTIWRSSQASPGIDRVLSFDPENGLLAVVDTAGQPAWIDLRLGSVRRPGSKLGFASLSSADGWAVYGVSSKHAIVRMTPTGDWQHPASKALQRLVPTPDGTVLVLLDEGENAGRLVRMRPPDEELADSVDIPAVDRVAVTPVGDRVYLGSGNRLLSVLPNDVQRVERFSANDEILAIAPTPSGDRVFIATKGSERLQRFDRYDASITASVRLPGLVTELRMDPLGRYLLARPVKGDSAWVISLASEDVVGTVATRWRSDLPAVALDGRVAAIRGSDVTLADARTGKVSRTIPGGAADVWFFTRWNGFRPRARGIDEPVSFRTGGSTTSVSPIAPGSTSTTAHTADSSTPRPLAPPEPVAPAPRARTGWTLSFAAVLSLERAREIANTIEVNGNRPRIAAGEANGTPVYRVVMGPFDSKDEAERVGRASGHSYWVFEGAP